MTRVLLNPTFDIETGKLLYHDGVFHVEHIPIRCDRGISKQAGSNSQSANSTASGFGTTASGIAANVIPGLERQNNNPTGFTPLQKNRQLTASMESTGGANAAITGEGRLAALRSRSAGGLNPALDEAARAKSRQLSSNALQVNNADAMLAQQKQAEAQRQLVGLYGTDTSNQLRAMNLADQDLQTELNAKKQGWLQDAEGVADTGSRFIPGRKT